MKRLSVIIGLFIPMLAMATTPQTLLEMVGVKPIPATLSNSVLVIIDAQQEYVKGALPLAGIDKAVDEGRWLLERARTSGTPVVHIMHRGNIKLFNPNGHYFSIVKALAPQEDEVVIEKRLPNAFAGTSLLEVLKQTGRKHLLVIGFMTHMCVSATVRSALDYGYATTVVVSATATRDLPDGQGGRIPAKIVQQVSLAALADRFATIAGRVDDIDD